MTKVNPLPITAEQKEAILQEAEKEDEFDYVLFLTLATTGKRIGELFGVQIKKKKGQKIVGKNTVYIQGKPVIIDKVRFLYQKTPEWRGGVLVEDIDFDRGVMLVKVLKKRKFEGREETILPPSTARAINKYIRGNRLSLTDYVFRRKGRSLRNIQQKLKYYAKKANVPLKAERDGMKYALSLHSFRHYFVTSLQRGGVSNDDIIKLTGHKETKTLNNYSHIVASDVKDRVMDKLKKL